MRKPELDGMLAESARLRDLARETVSSLGRVVPLSDGWSVRVLPFIDRCETEGVLSEFITVEMTVRGPEWPGGYRVDLTVAPVSALESFVRVREAVIAWEAGTGDLPEGEALVVGP